jgi:hypothetical protein
VSAFDKILDRLARVRRTGPTTATASCPTSAHANGDRSRGLGLRDTGDRVLIFCHAGCTAAEVVEGLGLTLGDLYDRPAEHRGGPTHGRIAARDLLELISRETSVIAIIAADMRARKAITESDWERFAVAASRIGKARDHVR